MNESEQLQEFTYESWSKIFRDSEYRFMNIEVVKAKDATEALEKAKKRESIWNYPQIRNLKRI